MAVSMASFNKHFSVLGMRSISSLIRDKTRSEIVRLRTQAALFIDLTTTYRSVLAACIPTTSAAVVAGKPLALRVCTCDTERHKNHAVILTQIRKFTTDVN